MVITMKFKSEICGKDALSRAIARIAHEIIERNESSERLVLIGIKKGGIPFAHRLSDYIFKKIDDSKNIPVAEIDISHFRDDIPLDDKTRNHLSESLSAVDINGKTVVLTDDVICTGRTARAAIEAVFAHGRPDKIQLAVMVDRGHRELPIRPDFVGKNLPTSHQELIKVSFEEKDGKDSIEIFDI